MSKPQRKVSIDLNIKSANIKVTEPKEVQILWKRGSKSIDTKLQMITPEDGVAVFNEKFQMKTAIEWDSLRNKFGKKKSILSVFSKDMK
mmetsp:Transcript_21755/g.15582  ORF Transcript_21755/g.15582 Transcript_21755/m.15582 type:complete len:89 (+) Transcript_21755:62-328(+)